ncbi:MAG: PTS mannose transporter subunit IID [Enterobacteriaceae bacterium PSpicST2]|nr:MAG: PTS mannose transporter subunit IID [Enterobacteriaceae bacterium PSpicST2]WMC19057.1 MAG: PTS mannose transporter subunit IID [Enterobacteriaceae bacterium PSpicST1]
MKKKLTFIDINKVILRSNLFQGSWNFERMQALGFCFSIIPAIRRLYPKKTEDRKKAIQRHLEFFNTHPYVAAPIIGVVLALEEQKANGVSISDSTINNIKIGLMGPFAGVGDPIFWGTIRPILSALGAGIAMDGSLLGPIIFFVSFNIIRLTIRYLGVIYGYKKGINIIKDISDGVLQKITEGASILGLFVMGALVSKWTHINIPVIIYKVNDIYGNNKITTIQNILDQLMPGLIPLLLTFLCMWFLKKINALWIILIFFVIGIIGYKFGFLSL